ncbi:hypothetical protein [Salinispora arenicola]|uniref:hypothetical protein n=1 Tax=Salinispora arenicola TaxID=168697 RepID=UPI00036A0F49|nr:hypothetical protein [Salinispora arenicola]
MERSVAGRDGRLMFFDVENPPIEPPAECRRRLLWRLARALWEAHRPGSTRMFRLFRRRRRRRLVPVDATGPATVYTARAGAYRPLRDQPTVILDTRPLMTRLARQRACQR